MIKKLGADGLLGSIGPPGSIGKPGPPGFPGSVSHELLIMVYSYINYYS